MPRSRMHLTTLFLNVKANVTPTRRNLISYVVRRYAAAGLYYTQCLRCLQFNITMLTDNKLRAFKKRGPRLLTNPADIKQVRLADSTHDAKSRAKLINSMLLGINTKGDDGTILEERYAFVYDTLVEEATNRH
ncbi:hypothetical protein K504DRAFT_467053 [Pleomassaria siparia CBS 279.74]|uniref:Uncharacterized protein n=1 Tax=Pleomassaria siparia CBS 279.74 TaxID=1314801 RepID=A0A6G1JPK9_9PLEO|nr:hypothetical protein K504DRAFT_467053 [Pleomassaria siparia CBS 279.74]